MDDPLYRDLLVREMSGVPDNEALFGRFKTVCFGLQNPSTAGEEVNDPTVHRTMGISRRLGFGRLMMTNTYRRRFTQPKDLYAWLAGLSIAQRAEEQHKAAEVMICAAMRADLFIAGWGNGHPKDGWPSALLGLLVANGVSVYHLGLNKNGTPKHPLARGRNRIPDDQQPILWRSAPARLQLHG